MHTPELRPLLRYGRKSRLAPMDSAQCPQPRAAWAAQLSLAGNSAENLQGLTFAFLEWRSVKSLNQSGLLAHPPKPTPVSAFRNSPPPVFDLFRFGLLAHAPELE